MAQRRPQPNPVTRRHRTAADLFIAGMAGLMLWGFSHLSQERPTRPEPAPESSPSYAARAPTLNELLNPPTSSRAAITPDPPTGDASPKTAFKQDADPPSIAGQRRKIAGHKVALRELPEAGSPIVDRLNSRQVVTVIDQRMDWAYVRVSPSGREGWLQYKRLGAQVGFEPNAEPNVAPEEPKPEPKRPEAKLAPVLPAAVVIKRLIADSLANYSGNCPCPYNSDRAGRSCGRRSAYSRPGGASPLCYAKDITPEMIEAYRSEN